MNTKKVTGIAKMDNQTLLCFGNIEILGKKDKQIYVLWQMFDSQNNLIASISKDYFIGRDKLNEDDIFELIIRSILNYRIRRKRIFLEVKRSF